MGSHRGFGLAFVEYSTPDTSGRLSNSLTVTKLQKIRMMLSQHIVCPSCCHLQVSGTKLNMLKQDLHSSSQPSFSVFRCVHCAFPLAFTSTSISHDYRISFRQPKK